jgi:O-antigen/teichoic acid export membrane protein
MQGPEVRRRAVSGVAVVAGRGVLMRVIGFGGTIVLARLLAPHDFGLIAFGSTLMVFAHFVADGGLGASLIRGSRTPEPADLRALLGFQLLVSGLFAAATAAAAMPFGTGGRVVAVIVASLPIATLSVPAAIMLERELAYRPLALAEVLATLSYFIWAIGTIVALDWGVWGLATGSLVRTVVSVVVVVTLSPVRLPRPMLSWERVRGMLPFGVRFQGVVVVALLRDQSLNIGAAAIGSVSILGVWSLAAKLLSAPYVLFESLWRVGYPAMARLLGAGEDPRRVLERGTGLVAAVNGAMLAPLAGVGPALVPVVFGATWSSAADALPWACLGLMISGPISVVAAGYLSALGDVRAVLRSTAVSWAALALVTFPLLPRLGVMAMGLGAMASALAEAFILVRAVGSHSQASIVRPLVAPVAAAIGSGSVTWILTDRMPTTVVTVVVGLAVAEFLYVATLLVIRRGLVVDTTGMLNRMIRLTFARA